MNRWLTVAVLVLLVLVGAMGLHNQMVASTSSPVPPTPWLAASTSSPVPPTPWLAASTSSPVPPTPWRSTSSPVPPTPWN